MKKRIYQIAKEIGISNQECVKMAQQLGLSVSTASNSLSEMEEQEVVVAFHSKSRPVKKTVPVVKSRKQGKVTKKAYLQQVSDFTEKYEKKPKKKEHPPKVKTISRKRANVLFLLMLMFVTAVLIGLGGIGIATDIRMNQLVKETNQAIKILNEENQNQSEAIQQLQKVKEGQ
jgi:cell division protein FtsB